MNKILAEIVGYLNGLLAFGLIAGGCIWGFQMRDMTYDDSYIIYGIVAGVVAAIGICAVLAIFISIRDELKVIRTSLQNLQD